MSREDSSELPRLHSLDGLRGFAAVAVAFFHYGNNSSSPLHFEFSKWLLSKGSWPVPIFFCLSGFLIYQNYLNQARHEKKVNGNFYIRRFLRIIPLWWLVVTYAFMTSDTFPNNGGIDRGLRIKLDFSPKHCNGWDGIAI